MTPGGATQPPPTPGRGGRAATLVGSLAPWRLLFGPVFQKEMRVSGRKLWTYLARAAYALILAVVVSLAFWGAWQTAGYTQSGAARIQSLQTLAPTVVASVLWFQFIATLLLAPVMTGGAINDEQRAQTLPTLLTTPLTALEIVCSKIASRMAHLLILALLALPILLGVRLFGGVRAETILAGATLSIVSAILAAAVGVLCSTLCRRATIASLLTYVVLVGIFMAPPLLAMRYNVLIEDVYPRGVRLPDVLGAWAPDWPAAVPMPAILASSTPAALTIVTVDPGVGFGVRSIWLASSVYTMALATGATLLAAASVRRAMRHSMSGPPPKRRRRRKGANAEGEDAQPVILAHRRSRTVSDHPVLWRELRQPLFNRKRTLALAIVVSLVIAALIYPGNLRDEGAAIVPIVLGMMMLLLQAALLSAPGLAAEREARTLDTLLTTRLSPTEIVWGKTLGAIRRQWFIPLLLMLHAGVFVVFGRAHWLLLVLLPIVMLGPVVLLAGTGTLFGLRFRKPVAASAANLALALTLWLALPILVGVLFGALEIAPNEVGEFVASVTLMLHPVGSGIFITDNLHGAAGDAFLSIEFDMPFGDINPIVFTMLVALCSGAQASIGVGATFLARARFARDTGRSS